MDSTVIRSFLKLLILCLVLCSCNREDVCLTPQIITTRATFVKRESSGNIKDSVVKAGRIFFGEPNLYFKDIISTSSFLFPLSPHKDSIRLYIQPDTSNIFPGFIDTISIRYNRNLAFISVACGYQTFYEIKGVTSTGHQIDSIIISNPSVNKNVNTQHLKLVFKK